MALPPVRAIAQISGREGISLAEPVGGSARSSKAKPYRSWSEAREGRARRWRREESYGNLVDCAFSGVFVGWRRLGLLPLAPVARAFC
jgi:hypothetical protein